MSTERNFEFAGADGTKIAAYAWPASTNVRAVLQISHGMGEHALRYLAPMQSLREAGISVYANDHRGHGRTARSPEQLGDFGPGGFAAVVDDMVRLGEIARRENPGKKLILLGHSMGSFALQIFLLGHSGLIDGAVLSGSAALDLMPPPDPSAPALDAFNAAFEPARTKFDWLSRDEAEVDAYVADPLCGFSMNASSMGSIFAAAMPLFGADALKAIRADLPLYLIAGDKDPVNGGLAWLTPLVERYRAAGVRDVSHDFYRDGRHEMFNETNRAEVVASLRRWLERVVA